MRYYIGLVITLGLLIVVLFLLFHGNSKTNVPKTFQPLYSDANTLMRKFVLLFTAINANENHNKYR